MANCSLVSHYIGDLWLHLLQVGRANHGNIFRLRPVLLTFLKVFPTDNRVAANYEPCVSSFSHKILHTVVVTYGLELREYMNSIRIAI